MNKKLATPLSLCLLLLAVLGCAQPSTNEMNSITSNDSLLQSVPVEFQDTATVGGGCFWCTEAQYQLLDGVLKVKSGYSGGHIKNPAYREVCNGTTGHAEVIQVVYDNRKLDYQDVLEAFFISHDPTQLNRQGNDVGTQYRSVIFYHSDEQQRIATDIKNRLDASGAYSQPIVTEITAFTVFYPAEDYHQNYFNQNGDEPYCQYVVAPKVDKFKKVFKDKLKH